MNSQKVTNTNHMPVLRWLLHLKIEKLKICLGYVNPSSEQFLNLVLALSGAEMDLVKLETSLVPNPSSHSWRGKNHEPA